jgi:hypothetical protein
MLGLAGAPYHLEFTCKRGHMAGRAPTEDNLLVFYLPDKQVWQQLTKWRRLATRQYRRTTRTGIVTGARMKTRTATELCYRMRPGWDKEDRWHLQ